MKKANKNGFVDYEAEIFNLDEAPLFCKTDVELNLR